MTFRSKMVTLQITVSEKAKMTMERQARDRGIALSHWMGQLFDAAFTAACAREKSMPVSDGDLDAIVGATLLLRAREQWDTATIAQALGVSEPTVVRILDTWKTYRAGSPSALTQPSEVNHLQAAKLKDALSMADLLKLKMRKKFRIVLDVLVRNAGTFVPTERIASQLYSDDPDGGPDDAEGLVHNHVCLIRKNVLAEHGWTITASRGEGYRLERLPA